MLTVIGTIGKTHGVSRVTNPQKAAVPTNTQKPMFFFPGGGSWSRTAFKSSTWFAVKADPMTDGLRIARHRPHCGDPRSAAESACGAAERGIHGRP